MGREGKKRFRAAWLCVLMIVTAIAAVSFSPRVQASTTSKAKKQYKKKISAISRISDDYSYRITNIVGSKTPELLIAFTESGDRHSTLYVYTYKSGKAKKILSAGADNLDLYLYKKTNSLVVSESYHDYQASSYYKYSSGKFRLKAVKCHNDLADPTNWYENASGSRISKSKYNKAVKKLKKGKRTNLNTGSWSYHSNY